jgi:hypothetical protein
MNNTLTKNIFGIKFILLLFAGLLILSSQTFASNDQEMLLSMTKQNKKLTEALISVLKNGDNQTEAIIHILRQNQNQTKLLIQALESIMKQQDIILGRLVKNKIETPRVIEKTVVTPPQKTESVPKSAVTILEETKIKSEATQPCRLKQGTLLHNHNKHAILKLVSPLIVELDNAPPHQGGYHKVYFTSWVIESYNGKKFVTFYSNDTIKVLYNVNTRTAPTLNPQDKIGAIIAGNTFHVEQERNYNGYKWYKIRIDALVHKSMLR